MRTPHTRLSLARSLWIWARSFWIWPTQTVRSHWRRLLVKKDAVARHFFSSENLFCHWTSETKCVIWRLFMNVLDMVVFLFLNPGTSFLAGRCERNECHISQVCTWSIKQSNKRYSLPRRKENRETWRLHGHWIQMRVRLFLQSHKGMRFGSWVSFRQKNQNLFAFHASLSVIHFSVLYNWPNRSFQFKTKKRMNHWSIHSQFNI